MGIAARAGRSAIKLAGGLADTAALLAVLLLLAAGCYALWDSGQVYREADARQYESYKPTVEDGGLSFGELQKINPEVFSWLTVYGTNIDYPVAQGENNMKYVNTNAEGRYAVSGAIFLDSGSSADFSDFSSIFYGHHMEKKAMFGELGLFADGDYFDARRYGSLYYAGEEHGLEFFAFLHTDAYNSEVFRTKVTGGEEQAAYLAALLDLALHSRDIGVTAEDRIVLLSTCSDGTTNGRDILVGRLADALHGDPFAVAAEKPGSRLTQTVDGLPGLWAQAPLWARVLVFALPLAALLLLGAGLYRRRRRGARGRNTGKGLPGKEGG